MKWNFFLPYVWIEVNVSFLSLKLVDTCGNSEVQHVYRFYTIVLSLACMKPPSSY